MRSRYQVINADMLLEEYLRMHFQTVKYMENRKESELLAYNENLVSTIEMLRGQLEYTEQEKRAISEENYSLKQYVKQLQRELSKSLAEYEQLRDMYFQSRQNIRMLKEKVETVREDLNSKRTRGIKRSLRRLRNTDF